MSLPVRVEQGSSTPRLDQAQLAQAMIGRAIDAGVPFAWFTADEAYGQAEWLRAWLEEAGVSYVLAISRNYTWPPRPAAAGPTR